MSLSSRKRIVSKAIDGPLKKVKGSLLESVLPPDLYKRILALPSNNNWNIVDALEHLITVDERFKTVIIDHGYPSFYEEKPVSLCQTNYFHELMKIIVYQQLAGNVAEQIFNRVLRALNVNANDYCKPETVLSATIDIDIRQGKRKVLVNGIESGLSLAKASYLKSLADHFNDKNCLKDVDLNSLDDDTLVKKLVDVKGLGIWSAQMFLLFNLRRPNVLAIGDLGIRHGLCHFLGRSKDSFEGKKQQEMVTICSHWEPYSSVGCALMWKIADSKKAVKTKLPSK